DPTPGEASAPSNLDPGVAPDDRVRRPGDDTRAALVARNLVAGVSCPVDRASRWVLVAPWTATTLSLRAA
ncbi:MAG: hypothetical protein M1557_07250, partial [Actinobacteria bacterium]|nr:hypothetical protein [Actinomycetota bacterium]